MRVSEREENRKRGRVRGREREGRGRGEGVCVWEIMEFVKATCEAEEEGTILRYTTRMTKSCGVGN